MLKFPVWLVWCITIVFTSAGFFLAFRETGAFCYALDDSFIMMALAKNLAFHQTWGLTQHQFSSTASSPLFAVLLAGADWVFGEFIWMPLIINMLALAGLYGLVATLCNKWGFSSGQTFLMLLGLFLLMPVPVLLFGSMEHLLHTFIAVGVLALVLEYEDRFPVWTLFPAGFLLASVRYEGLFEGGLIILWLWSRKKWLNGLLLGGGMLLPVSILGFYSMAQGWFFLPNSLVLKAYGMNVQETGSLAGFLLSLLSKAGSYPHCIVAILALYLVKDLKAGKLANHSPWIWIVLLTSISHFLLARYGHVYRYEAYLMGLAWIAFFRSIAGSGFAGDGFEISGWLKKNSFQVMLFSVLIFSPLYRCVESFLNGSKAIVNIYEQQVQTGKFVRQFYNKSCVAAIDVGAIAYYSDCRLIDLWGLGNMEFARLKLENRYRPAEIDSVCRMLGVELAIAYGNPVKEPGWNIQESWAIQDNRVCARDTVDFYSLDPQKGDLLRKNLSEFRPRLPARVLVIKGNLRN